MLKRLEWLLLIAAPLLAGACAEQPRTYRPLGAGDEAPAFGAPDLEGNSLSLKRLRGQPVLLNIWATWCPPCREEMPHLQQLHEMFGERGLRVVGVSVDSRGSESAIHRFLEEAGVTFTILHDAADVVSREFRTIGVPETFLIDRDGVIRRRWIGKFDPLQPDVVRDVEAVLQTPGARGGAEATTSPAHAVVVSPSPALLRSPSPRVVRS